MIICKFIPYKDKFACEKCGYITANQNVKRMCQPLIQRKEPTLVGKIKNFTIAFAGHLFKGMPSATEEVVKERLEICRQCPLFKPNESDVGGICTHESCGCNIQDHVVFLNKLAWADQSCPLKKWEETTKIGQSGV